MSMRSYHSCVEKRGVRKFVFIFIETAPIRYIYIYISSTRVMMTCTQVVNVKCSSHPTIIIAKKQRFVPAYVILFYRYTLYSIQLWMTDFI